MAVMLLFAPAFDCRDALACDVTACGFGPECGHALAEVLKTNTTLKDLNCEGNEIGPVFEKFLYDLFACNAQSYAGPTKNDLFEVFKDKADQEREVSRSGQLSCSISFHSKDPFVPSSPKVCAVDCVMPSAFLYWHSPLRPSLPQYFRYLLSDSGYMLSTVKLPLHWFKVQLGSNQTFFVDRPPQPGAALDIPTTIASSKPMYMVQSEVLRPAPKVLVPVGWSILVPLNRFSDRNKLFLLRFRAAFQQTNPFQVLIPTMHHFSSPNGGVESDSQHDAQLHLHKVTSFDEFLACLPYMVPLSSGEAQKLVAGMNLATDDVLVVDNHDSALDGPTFTAFDDFVATRENLDLSNSSMFWFDSFKVFETDKSGKARDDECSTQPPKSVLYDWCKKIPSICVLEDVGKLEGCENKLSLVVQASSSTFSFDDLRSVLKQNPQLEHLEVRFVESPRPSSHRILIRERDGRNRELLQSAFVPKELIIPHNFASNNPEFQPFACELKVSDFSRQIVFDMASLASATLTLDDECSRDLIDRMKTTRIPPLVRTLAFSSTWMGRSELASVLSSCPGIEVLRLTVEHDSNQKNDWPQLPPLPNVRRVDLRFKEGCDCEDFLLLCEKLFLRFDSVKCLALQSDSPNIFTLLEADIKKIGKASAIVTDLILDFPCTRSHFQLLSHVFSKSRVSAIDPLFREPKLFREPLEVTAQPSIARFTFSKDSSEQPPLDVGMVNVEQIEVLGPDFLYSGCLVDAFYQKAQPLVKSLSCLKTITFFHSTALEENERAALPQVQRLFPHTRVFTASSYERNVSVGALPSRKGYPRLQSATTGDLNTGYMQNDFGDVITWFCGLHPSNYRMFVCDTIKWTYRLVFDSQPDLLPCTELVQSGDDGTDTVTCTLQPALGIINVPQVWVGNRLAVPMRWEPADTPMRKDANEAYYLDLTGGVIPQNVKILFELTETPRIQARPCTPLPADVQRALHVVNVMSDLGILHDDSSASKVQKIAGYCSSFGVEDSPSDFEFNSRIARRAPQALAVVEPKHFDAVNYFLRLFLFKRGVCRHRAQVATVLCHFFGVTAFCVSNDVHTYLEAVLNGCITRFDLGGGQAPMNLIDIDGNKVEVPVNAPCFEHQVEDLVRTNLLKIFAVTHSSAKPIQPTSSAPSESSQHVPAPSPSPQVFDSTAQQQCVQSLLDMITVKCPLELPMISWFRQKESCLIETQNSYDGVRVLLNHLALQRDQTIVLHIQNLYDMQHARESVVYCDSACTFKIEIIAHPVCIVVDYAQMLPNDIVDLQAAIEATLRVNETDGKEKVCVIGVIDSSFAVTRSEDFFSRWRRRIIWNTVSSVCSSAILCESALLQCHLHAVPCSINAAPYSAETIVMDLRGSQRWKCILLGGVCADGGNVRPVCGERTLLHQLQQTRSDSLHLCIRNAPCFSRSFSMWWEALLRNKSINHYGQVYTLPPSFSWSFEVSDERIPELKPLSAIGDGMVWFVQSGTVQFVHSFPYIDSNGIYQQHPGFLKEMESSGRIVVDSSSLTTHEIVDLIVGTNGVDGPLSKAHAQGRVFTTSHPQCDPDSFENAALRGRAVRFSLKSRVMASLIHQDGLKWRETAWLHELEDEHKEFTIILPREHPDLQQVLNWISYRQVWFQHRAVHVRASLHLMYTPHGSGTPTHTSLNSASWTAAGDLENILREQRLVVLSGPPSSGKSFLAKTFHRYQDSSSSSSSSSSSTLQNLGEQTPSSGHSRQLLQFKDLGEQTPCSGHSRQLLRFVVNSQINQLPFFLQVQCDAVLVIDEYNLQNEGTWDDLLAVLPTCPGYDGTFFYNGEFHRLDSSHCKTVLLIGNPSTQTGRVASVIDSHCCHVQCDKPTTEELIRRAIPTCLSDFEQLRERLAYWVQTFEKRLAAFKSNNAYLLTLRDYEAVLFEALHMRVSLDTAAERLLGYYLGCTSPMHSIQKRIEDFVRPAQGVADVLLQCCPTARKRGLFFIGESGVGKTHRCSATLQQLMLADGQPWPHVDMQQSDPKLQLQLQELISKSDSPGLQAVTSDVAHIRDKAVLIAAKLGFILFVDEFNSDRNLRLEGTLNQVLASGSGRDVHPNFFVICTGNPPRFHGRHKLPASLQTRFATVQLDPISHAELHDIIQQQVDKSKGRFPEQITESLADCDKIELWSRAFVAAKRKEPLLNLRALEGALKGNPQAPADSSIDDLEEMQESPSNRAAVLAVTPAEGDAPQPLVPAGADSRSDPFEFKGLTQISALQSQDQTSAAAVASRITGSLLHVLSREDLDHVLSHPHVLRESVKSVIQAQQQRTASELLVALMLVFVAMVLMFFFRRV